MGDVIANAPLLNLLLVMSPVSNDLRCFKVSGSWLEVDEETVREEIGSPRTYPDMFAGLANGGSLAIYYH